MIIFYCLAQIFRRILYKEDIVIITNDTSTHGQQPVRERQISISSSADSMETVEHQESEITQQRSSQAYRGPPPSYEEVMFDRTSNTSSVIRQNSSLDVYVTRDSTTTIEIGSCDAPDQFQAESIRQFPLSLTRGRQLQYPSSNEEDAFGYTTHRNRNRAHEKSDGNTKSNTNISINTDSTGHITRPHFRGTIEMSIIYRHVNEGISTPSTSNWQMATVAEDDDSLPSYNEAVRKSAQ